MWWFWWQCSPGGDGSRGCDHSRSCVWIMWWRPRLRRRQVGVAVATAVRSGMTACGGGWPRRWLAVVVAAAVTPALAVTPVAFLAPLPTHRSFVTAAYHLLGRLTAVASEDLAARDPSNPSPAITNLGQLWEREVGPSSWPVSLAVLLVCFGTALSYSIVLGDTARSLAEAAGLVAGPLASRRFHVVAVALLGVYPLCSLKSLAALAPVSVAGVVGVFATCAVMARQARPGGPYAAAKAGAGAVHYLAALPPALRPRFGTTGLRGPRSALVLASTAATSYLVHGSAPAFRAALDRPTPARFGALCALGFGGAAALGAIIMAAGFLTFGGASTGMILNNYAAADPGAGVCRLLTMASLLGSYAFLNQMMKDAFYAMCWRGREVTDRVHRIVTRGSVALLTGLALLVR